MINGHVTIRIGTDQTLSWEGPRETELYTYWKATLGDLEAMAVNAISRWIVMQSERLHRQDWPRDDPIAALLLG